MAISGVPKLFTDVSLRGYDATGTPIALTFAYWDGIWNVAGVREEQKDVVKLYDRGTLYGARKTQDVHPTGSFSVHATDYGSATEKTVMDFVRKTGAWAAAVSPMGSYDNAVWAPNLELTIAGILNGDSADHWIRVSKCLLTLDFATGAETNLFTLNYEALGGVETDED